MKKILIFIAFLVFCFFFYRAISVGLFRAPENLHNADCRKVYGAPGSEDIEIHRGHGKFAFLSSSDRRLQSETGEISGAIYAYVPGSFEKPKPIVINGNFKGALNPHGISHYYKENEFDRLFVVNHPGDNRHTIEIFDYKEAKLNYVTTIESSEIISPNDVAAVNEKQFYFTNDHASTDPFQKNLETYLNLGMADLRFFDGNVFHTVARELNYPNGAFYDQKSKKLYFAETLIERLNVYSFKDSNLKPESIEKVKLNSQLDNIDLDADGQILVTGHINSLKLLKHFADEKEKSPFRIEKIDPKTLEVSDFFIDDGSLISGASVAVKSGSRLIIGPIAEAFFLDCELKN